MPSLCYATLTSWIRPSVFGARSLSPDAGVQRSPHHCASLCFPPCFVCSNWWSVGGVQAVAPRCSGLALCLRLSEFRVRSVTA